MSDAWEEDGNPWIVKSVSRQFENNWFAVDGYDVIRPDGAPATYSVAHVRRLAVGVLPIEADGRVHLVGQWRFPLRRYSWEMPEGGADAGEAPLACAQRELKEETGLTADHFEPILEMDLSNSLTDEQAFIFLATGLRSGQASPEPVEVLKRRTAPFSELLARIVDGRIRDSMTVAAVLRAHHMAVTGQLPHALAAAMLGSGRGE